MDDYKPKKLLLKGMPEEMYAELVRIQGDHKKKYLTQFSLEAAVYKFFKTHLSIGKE